MTSMIEVNSALKENFQRQLADIKSLPEDLALGYKNWVRGVVKRATEQVQAEAEPQEQGAQQQGDVQ